MKGKKTCALVSALAALAALSTVSCENRKNDDTVKVGILHSMTGAMAGSEIPVVNAEKMAIDELNANGGVLGKKIKAIQADGKSIVEPFELPFSSKLVFIIIYNIKVYIKKNQK